MMRSDRPSDPQRSPWTEAVADIESMLLTVFNPVFFHLRNAIRFRRPGYSESREHPPEERLELEIAARAGFARLAPDLSEWSWRANLHVYDLLSQILDRAPPARTARTKGAAVLDIGSKNFEYALGMLGALRDRYEDPVALTGIELDAYRVYRGMHSRFDAAEYFLDLSASLFRDSPRGRYLAGNVLRHRETYDLITWFSPFLTPFPHLRWGLSRSSLEPRATLQHVLSLLRDDGMLVVVNQEPDESTIQRELFAACGATADSFPITSRFPRKHATCYAHVARAPHST